MFGRKKREGKHRAPRGAPEPEVTDYEPAIKMGPVSKAALAMEIFFKHKGNVRYAKPYHDVYRGNLTMAEADEEIIRLQLADDTAEQAVIKGEEEL